MLFSVVEIVAVSLFFGDVEMHRMGVRVLASTPRRAASRLTFVINDIFTKYSQLFNAMAELRRPMKKISHEDQTQSGIKIE